MKSRAFWLGFACLWVGCAERDLDWSYRFASSEVRARTSLMEARISADACEDIHGEGRDIQFLSELPPGGTSATAFPPLPPGRWSFYIQARDESCGRIAEGCVEVDLPGEEAEIVVTLEAVDPVYGCYGACAGGGACAYDADGG